MVTKKLLHSAFIFCCFILAINANAQTVATFENLALPADTFWNGSNMSGGFTDGGFYFPNTYTSFGGSAYAWSGFAYSTKFDTLTTGLPAQFSAACGKGYNNSATYAVSSVLADWNTYQPIPNTIKFNTAKTITGFYATNNTYAYLSMLNGDAFSKKFGGTNGNDADWFMIKIKGFHAGIITDTVKFYLADFRFANNTSDYIVKDWRWCNLSSLGAVDSIQFTLYSTDNGLYGMNTPSYFCMDNFNGTAPLSIDSYPKEDAFNLDIYPNPFKDILTINIPDNTKGKLTITDITGKEIISISDFKGGNLILNELKAGLYLLTFNTSKSIYTQKIFKH